MKIIEKLKRIAFKHCPKCETRLVYRELGWGCWEYKCPKCGHKEQ